MEHDAESLDPCEFVSLAMGAGANEICIHVEVGARDKAKLLIRK
jgi:hypothetical protein